MSARPLPWRMRFVLISAIALTAVTIAAIFFVDGPVATWIRPNAASHAKVAGPFVGSLEIIFGFPLSKFATGAVILLCSAAAFLSPRFRGVARLLLFAGSHHLATRLVAGVLKNVFLRTRPDDAFAGGGWQDRFFVEGGSSFPSGHAAHFWALYFAAVLVFPKLRITALMLAVAVSIARVAVNDHYVSDVLASAAIAAWLAVVCALLVLPRATPRTNPS